ncbi:MAG: hypothetical protein CVU87_02670 [Firmicutes bacterium HGW-Firmicutes-12]|jgi:hypothetical protein|nr:MAG: hypothetical protein CVU87_02670 [Firmicutes bacterium HGW-Firmicutes-12]
MKTTHNSKEENTYKVFIMDRCEAIFEEARRTFKGKRLYKDSCIKLETLRTGLSNEKSKEALEFEIDDTAYYIFLAEKAYKQGIIDGVTECMNMGFDPDVKQNRVLS